MAKRIYSLAKELGVDSKTIVAKCEAEGLGGTIKNHMSTLSAGLEATIREWFSEEENAHTAIEVSEKVDVAAAKRRATKKRRKKKAKVEEAEVSVATAVAEAPEGEVTEQLVAKAEVTVEPEEKKEEPAEEEVGPAEEAKPEGPKEKPEGESEAPPEAPEPPEITPAPLHVPEPAKLQGPKVIRVEAPEPVRPLRPRPRPARSTRTSEPAVPAAEDVPRTPAPSRIKGRRAGQPDEMGEDGKPRRQSKRRGLHFDAGDKVREWRDRDLIERRERLAQASGQMLRGRQSEIREHPGPSTLPRSGKVSVSEPVTVKELSSAIGVKSSDIISKLMSQGVMASINDTIQTEAAEVLALDYGVALEIDREEGQMEIFVREYESLEAVEVKPRAPVVTLLGHVDHGKTSLLDYIRKSHVVSGEAGGITQHIGAYRVNLGDDRYVVFLDTPGHEAFTAMRARGANMTDVVVLVVAADDGVMPQTAEAINHAKAAGVPVVVALNKIDLPGVDINRILGQLAEKDLTPQEWGGETDVVQTSATTGQGVDDLLEHLSYIAELQELKADVGVPAGGAVVEAELDPRRGVVARLLVQKGTLKVGDAIVASTAHGRVRAVLDDTGKALDEAGPSTPVEVTGLDVVPEAGDKFYVVADMSQAKALAEECGNNSRQRSLSRRPEITLENFMGKLDAGQAQELCLIVRADVQGSVDVLCQSLQELSVSEVRVKILQAMVGGITEGDVLLAQASGAIILGFNVVAGERARALAEQSGVDIRPYRVIYELLDEVTAALERRLAPSVEEKVLGHLQVRQIFKISRVGTVAGCYVTDGVVARSNKVRLIRDGVVVNDEMTLESLKRVKDDAREVKSGLECGIKLAGFDDVKVDDTIEFYEKVEVARTLSSVAKQSVAE